MLRGAEYNVNRMGCGRISLPSMIFEA
jgi:hypothetical protein